MPKIKVSVQAPSHYKSQPSNSAFEGEVRNDLFGSSHPANQLYKYRKDIESVGLSTGNDFIKCLTFVKSLSATKDLKYAL